MAFDIFVIAEHRDGKLKKSTGELLTVARKLAAAGGGKVLAAAIGAGASKTASDLAAWGAGTVLIAEGPALEHYSSLRWTRVICDAIATRKPAVILMTVSSLSRDLAGRIAARANAVLASDCTALSAEGGGFKLVRPILAGRALVTAAHAAPRRCSPRSGRMSSRPKNPRSRAPDRSKRLLSPTIPRMRA